MSKTWYPVIDYAVCTECGICVENCPHNVYDTSKSPTPVVKEPENCIDHGHGCGDPCPVGAITYVGEDTGWTPSKGSATGEAASCDAGGDRAHAKTVLVEYLYLDLDTCERCIGTDLELIEVLDTITPALQLAGYFVQYKHIEMTTPELARRYRFLSSPTIRVNGVEIGGPVKENDCGCCSDISGTDVDCRVWETEGQSYEVPPQEMLTREILRVVFGPQEGGCGCDAYEIPENLVTFYQGKASGGCNCGGECE